MGRFESEESPSIFASRFCPDKSPIMSLVVVPEFPMSSAFCGCCNPVRPTPSTSTCSPFRTILTPRSCKAFIVLRQSSPHKKCSITVLPSLIAPIIKARCEMLLSPGTVKLPCSPFFGAFCKIFIIFSSLFDPVDAPNHFYLKFR